MLLRPFTIIKATRGPIFLATRPLHIDKPNWNVKAKQIASVKDLGVTVYKSMREKYDHLTGMPEIVAAQRKVSEIQQKMIEIQNSKGPVKLEIHRLREELAHLNHSLQMCKRLDANYLNIISRIVELNQREETEQAKYDHIEEESRSTFTNLMLAVQNSQELDRNQTAHFKYFSWIFSIVWGGLTSLIFLLKYLTQTTGFKDLEGIMGKSDKERSNEFKVIKTAVDDVSHKLFNLNKTNNSILQRLERQKPNKSASDTAYEWAAWAVSPLKHLKFW